MEIQQLTVLILGLVSYSYCDCVFPKHKDSETNQAIQRLKPLFGTRYPADDNIPDGYTYSIGICVSADPENPQYKNAGVIQREKPASSDDTSGKVPKPPAEFLVGRITDAQIMAGSNWILLEYEKGDNYSSHCGSEPRKASIMITCSQSDKVGNVRVIEENNVKTSDCYYLFELDHIAACPNQTGSGKLSAGSVVVIVFLVLAGVYLLGGFLYQRLVVGAKGMEQMPNFAFWQDFGNLQADGCDFICRCGGKSLESRQYRGIGDDQLQAAEDEIEVERDDSLLPM